MSASMGASLMQDYAQSLARFEAWWVGELVDRPPVTLQVAGATPALMPDAHHATLRDRWLDVAFQVERAIAALNAQTWVGDAVAQFSPNIGPELSSTPLGAALEFGDITSWSQPIIHDVSDWASVLERPLDFENPYWRAIEAMTTQALTQARGRYLVGLPDLHGNLDLLAGLREPQMLCVDLVDEPELMEKLLARAVEVYRMCLRRSWQQLTAAGQGVSTTWAPMLHAGLSYVPSCDFWALLSHEMAVRFAVPYIEREMEGLERSIFHLDGPQALRHLELVLALPGLHALQWVQGAGGGPARKWIDVYRRARTAGLSVQVLADDAEDALTVLDALGPEGVWLQVLQPFATREAAMRFLQAVKDRT